MLLLKILIAPVLIALISLAGRKWGPGIAGWLLGIPFNSGPILLFLVLEQGPQFASRAALGSLLGILAWVSFTLVYAYACLKFSWWSSTLLGWMIYAGVAALLLTLRLGVVSSFLVVSAALVVAILSFPAVARPTPRNIYRRYDLWLRMATASGMVVTMTGLARMLGPRASGILSAFPAYTTILAVFSHQQEPAAAVHVLKGVAVGLFTAATFFLILSPALLRLPASASFGLAIAGALLVQGGSLLYLRRT